MTTAKPRKKPGPKPGTGKRYGGRTKGTPNKLTFVSRQCFEQSKYDPLLSEIKRAKALDGKRNRTDAEEKQLSKMNRDLIPYLHPKLSTITHQGDTDQPLEIVVKYDA